MIFIDNRQNKIEVTEELESTIKNVVECALTEENVTIPCEVSIIFIDNEQIKEINKETRNIDRVTDVLSFPMLEYPKGKVFKEVYNNYKFHEADFDNESLVLGDIALSLEKAQEQGIEFNHSFLRETAYLTVHSILHLLGYDHMEDEEKSVMRNREEKILESFGLVR